MFKPTDVYIDLGTTNTLIYLKSRGFVLNEPSCLSVRSLRGKRPDLLALGRPSKQMLGKEPQNIQVIRPLRDGVIADYDKTLWMLDGFLRRIQRQHRWFRPKVVISLPCRVTRNEREAVREAALALGAHQVHLIEEPVAAAIGARLPILSPRGTMIIDIGGGTTEIAIIACGGIIHANAVRVGGNHFDESIIGFLKSKYGFLVGEQTAERLKIELGTALPESPWRAIEVGGHDLTTGYPRRRKFTSEDIYLALQEPVDQIVDSIQRAFAECPPEILGDVMNHGITLAGGGSLLRNLGPMITQRTCVQTQHCQAPLLTIAYGGAAVLENRSLLERIAI